MARERRGGKGGAKATTIPGTLTDSATTITAVASGLSTWSGATTNGKATATINRGLSDEETVTFTGISGNDLTGVTRGAAGTSAQAHPAAATLELTSSFTDVDEANELVAAMASNQVRVRNTGAFPMANNTVGLLTFDTERYDTGGLHSTGANTGRLTCVTAGKYLITGHVEWAANATGVRELLIKLNGTTYIARDTAYNGGTDLVRQSIATVYALSAADYVELHGYQDSGGSLDINVAGNYSPEFGMSFLGF